MKTVQVHASRTYDVCIGSGLLDSLGTRMRAAGLSGSGTKVAVITDDTVQKLYGGRVGNALTASGYTACFFVIPHGEQSKSAENYIELLEFLASNGLTRSDAIVALGGGVVGDLAGFAAATFLRGIPFVQVPTTLLAAVDSSVGGKTAIDLKSGKNLAGAFYQPSLVLSDLDTLQTLPPETLRDGYAEVIKYGMIADETLLQILETSNPASVPDEEIVARCVTIKQRIVETDERDNGERQLLNFGHTIGHAIEKCSAFSYTHGQAVAAGMGIITRAAVRMNLCTASVQTRLERILNRFGLPLTAEFTATELANTAQSDKKRSGASINLIVPRDAGHCVIHPAAADTLEEIIKAGL